ncbi:MAG: hypothetical protein PUE27_07805 [Sharpea porci]|uniref:hypothetical protein n=1 Tax=Sharpea porci TaxID=2652286 RepID=UPI00240A384F|nr:hypothetical protein [Sharpea porci]MDD6711965.1 hypothetical protein [Sharpea porci]
MNKDYLFLENLYQLLEQGYGIEETLLLCKEITHHPSADQINIMLKEGVDLKKAILESDFPKQFIEFFEFFSMRLTISAAIRNALQITQHLEKTKKDLISKLTYPLVLMSFLVMFCFFASFVLFPQVNALFTSFSIQKSILFTILIGLMQLIPILFICVIGIIVVLFLRFMRALKRKNYRIIEQYLHVKMLKHIIQKYFTLKFAIYFNEIMKDHLDANTIIVLLNETMVRSDIKIMIYEIYCRIEEGEAFEDIIENFEYFDQLFVIMYRMYLQAPKEIGDLSGYIDVVKREMDMALNKFIKYLIPAVYSFVAFFVIVVYIAIILPMMNVIGEI